MPGRKAGITTLLLKEINNNGKKLSFVYDAVGNIVTISENGVQKVKYTYNALSELTRVDSAWENKSITYTYDAGMNMTSRKEYSYTTGALGNAVKTDLFTYRASGKISLFPIMAAAFPMMRSATLQLIREKR